MSEQKDTAMGLVRSAFELARSSGRSDWTRMTIPVLKNRILLVTNGKFSERDFGAKSFRDFLERLPSDFIAIDDATPPGFVTYIQSGMTAPPAGTPLPAFPRIRPDLWRAVLDYSSGGRYKWDSDRAEARPAVIGDNEPFLPTLVADEFQNWRQTFANDHSTNADKVVASRLEKWVSESLPTPFLPARLRPAWNEVLKINVEKRLRDWFQQQHINPPVDLITVSTADHPSDIDSLRSFAIECIRVMTWTELQRLAIPISAILRMRGHAEQRDRA